MTIISISKISTKSWTKIRASRLIAERTSHLSTKRIQRNAPPPLPFESHLSSATAKYREKQQILSNQNQPIEDDLSSARSSHLVEGGRIKRTNIAENHISLDSAFQNVKVVGGRIKRVHIDQTNKSKVNKGGSVAASMTATVKYRQLRRMNEEMNPRTTEDVKTLANPSSISIPLQDSNSSDVDESSSTTNEKHDHFHKGSLSSKENLQILIPTFIVGISAIGAMNYYSFFA